MFYIGSATLIDSTSTSTSNWWYVGDFEMFTVSWTSSASLGPSRLTIQINNADQGFRSAMPATTSNTNTSVLSGVNMVGNTPGAALFSAVGAHRWVRITVPPANHSAASVAVVTIHGATL